MEAREVCKRVDALRQRSVERDQRHKDLLAIRRGDYLAVAPGIFPDDFDRGMVANLVDTAARDVAEVEAPLPNISCPSLSQSIETQKRFAAKRSQIALSYVERSRLKAQRFTGCDAFNSFAFLTYMVEPSFEDKAPIIRISANASQYYTLDGRGRVRYHADVYTMSAYEVCAMFPEAEAPLRQQGKYSQDQDVTIISWTDDTERHLILEDIKLTLVRVAHGIGRTPVAIVERPHLTTCPTGQFDDVIWMQVARAVVQQYTMSALEQTIDAPMIAPNDINELEMGPFSVIQTDNPQGVGRLKMDIPSGVFPESQILEQQQLAGSRYPQGRTGNIDASVITGQGVQALMGTFDTQIQTFQALDQLALEDAISMCFEMDEALWPNTEKTVRIKDSGSPYEVTYVPAKDIKGDHTVDVSYGAIAGLDPNRALVFVLQALAARLISKSTARRQMPVELNVVEEEKAIDLEEMRDSLAASIAAMPQLLPQMLAQGQDPRDIILDLAEVMALREKGVTIENAVSKVFAPKQPDQGQEPPPDTLAQLLGQGQGGGQAPPPAGAAGGPATPGQSLLRSLAGLSPGGGARLQANVSRQQPA